MKTKEYKYQYFDGAAHVTEWLNAHPDIELVSITCRGSLAQAVFYVFYRE